MLVAKYGYSRRLAHFERGERTGTRIDNDRFYTIRYNNLYNVCKIKQYRCEKKVTSTEIQDPNNCTISLARDAINKYHATLDVLGILPHPIAEAICEHYEGNKTEIYNIFTFYLFMTPTERETYYARHGIKIKSFSMYC